MNRLIAKNETENITNNNEKHKKKGVFIGCEVLLL